MSTWFHHLGGTKDDTTSFSPQCIIVAMKGPEEIRHRIAPSPERHEREPSLDIVVVIPCHDEWPGIIRTLASIAHQEKKQKELVHGVVVVINNRPDASEEIKSANMKTYTMLQLIRLGYPVHTKVPLLDHQIKVIQDRKLRIEVIDAFSDGYAHPQSNVGRARKIGTEHGLSVLKPENASIISTDADTIFGSEVIESVYKIFQDGHADAVALRSGHDTWFLDADSKRAFERFRLHWELRDAAKRTEDMIRWYKEENQNNLHAPASRNTSLLEDALVTMGGGYSAFTARTYTKSGGYKEIGTAEDTELSHSIAETGGVIKEIREHYPKAYVFTQPRISERTERGYGHTIAQWDTRKGAFADVLIPKPEAGKASYEFLQEVAILPESTGRAEFLKVCERHGISEEKAKELNLLYLRWNGKPNTREHFNLVQKTNEYFVEREGKLSVKEYRKMLEHKNEELSDLIEKKTEKIFALFGKEAFPSWKLIRTVGESLYDDFVSRHEMKEAEESKEIFLTYLTQLYCFTIENIFDVLQVVLRLFAEKQKLLRIEKQVFSFDIKDTDTLTPETFSDYANALATLTETQRKKVTEVLIESRFVSIMLPLSLLTNKFSYLFSQVQREVGYGLLVRAEERNNIAWNELLKEAGVQTTIKAGPGLFGEKP